MRTHPRAGRLDSGSKIIKNPSNKKPRQISPAGLAVCDGGFRRSVLYRPGGDRLSRGLSRSTIGAGGFNGRVRNGIGWNSPAMTTRSIKNASKTLKKIVFVCVCLDLFPDMERCFGDQANRAIRTSKLNALPRLHTWPIDVVVFHGSQAKPGFEVSFPLRCFQRLSRPYLATRLCHWRDNRSTRDTFFPVLSY